MKPTSFLSLGLLAFFAVGSCAPVKGYIGPELPPEQIATVYLSYDSNQVNINEARIAGTSFGYSGIQILPGRQGFELNLVTKEPPEDCYTYPEFDRYGFKECRKKNKHDYSNCDCYDYLEVKKRCRRTVQEGTCRGDLTTVAGRQYELQVSKRYDGGEVYVAERGGAGVAGDGTCTMGRERTETEDSSVGHGRSAAYQLDYDYCND